MAHPDLDALLNALLPFAKQMLEKRGEFFPFGASVGTDGKVAMVAAGVESERPASTEVIALLASGFREAAAQGRVKAVGTCFDAKVTPPGKSELVDAVCVRLEHASGQAVDIFLPYRRGFLGRFKYDSLFAAPGESKVFQKPSAGA